MATLTEVKTAIEEQARGTQALRDEVKRLQGDAVDKTAFKQLEELVQKADAARVKVESEYLAELEAVKAIAEEANVKAGRYAMSGNPAPDEVEIAHKSAFENYLRNPDDAAALSELKTAERAFEEKLGSPTGSGGGVAVPSVIAEKIKTKVSMGGIVRDLVNVVQVGTSDYSELVEKSGAAYGWVGAGDSRNGTDKPGIYVVEPVGGTIYAYPKAQEEQLEDVFFDLEAWLIKAAQKSFGKGIDAAIIAGDGTKKPLGMLGTAPVADADGSRADKVYQFIASGDAAKIGGAENVLKLVYNLQEQYRANASWLMNSLTTLACRTLKDDTGRFLWADSLVAGQPNTLAGYRVNNSEDMPDIAANATPLAFGDYEEGYTLVERHGFRITPDEVTEPGFKKWHMRRRVAGAPTNDDAIKFLKITA